MFKWVIPDYTHSLPYNCRFEVRDFVFALAFVFLSVFACFVFSFFFVYFFVCASLCLTLDAYASTYSTDGIRFTLTGAQLETSMSPE